MSSGYLLSSLTVECRVPPRDILASRRQVTGAIPASDSGMTGGGFRCTVFRPRTQIGWWPAVQGPLPSSLIDEFNLAGLRFP